MKAKNQTPEVKKFFVYRITNLVNSKLYIGKTHGPNPYERWYNHQHFIGYVSTYNDCPKLYNSMRKYGTANFTYEIIEEWEDEAFTYQREAELVEFYDTIENGLNTVPGGIGTMTGDKNPMFGKGYLIAGEKNGMFGMTGELNPFFGKKHSPEFIETIKRQNRVLSDEVVRAIKELLLHKTSYAGIREQLAMPTLGDVSINRIKSGKRYAEIASDIVLTESKHISESDAEVILRLWYKNPKITKNGTIQSQNFYKTEIEGKYNISPEKLRNLLKGNTWPSIHEKLARERLSLPSS